MTSRFTAAACLLAAAGVLSAAPALGDVAQLQRTFQSPPEDARIMVRWWWFGPAVTKEGIERELKTMKAGSIGGVEVQPTYPLALDGPGIKNLKFMSPEFLDMLGFTAAKCKELGLRMDLTLGSGWPYGGPMFTPDEGAQRIATQPVPVPAGQATVAAPAGAFAAFAGPAGLGAGGGRGRGGGVSNVDMSALKPIPIKDGAAQLPADFAGGEVLFFTTGRVGMMVKRPAFGAEGLVIDHLSSSVVEKFIKEIGEPEIKACGANPPYAIFCDSLEVSGENWTAQGIEEFQKLRGYDLRPHLPALLGNYGERTDDIRYDWGRTVTDMFNANFNARFTALARQYGTRFRIQGYGYPPAGLYSYAFADLPEGEGGGNGNWRGFRTTRYAASASHLMNVPVTSSETFTWLHQAPFRATPLDIKGEADTHFLDGVNQLICHGWPYTGEGASYPGWSFYAAGVFDEKNPWYIAMPDISRYLQRVSALLRQGTPANDIALYMPDADVWAGAASSWSSLNAATTSLAGTARALLEAGYNFDGFDDGMLELKGKVDGGALTFGDVKYKVAVLAGVQRMPLETARKLEAFAKGGGMVLAARSIPSRVPGMKATAADQEALKAIMTGLFEGPNHAGLFVQDENQLAAELAKKLRPDMAMEPANPEIGCVHRHVDDAEVYFVANTGNQRQAVSATFRVEGMAPELWDPLTGHVAALNVATGGKGSGTTVALTLEPYGSAVVVFSKRALAGANAPGRAAPPAMDLSRGWTVKFAGVERPVAMEALRSWTDDAATRNFSGVATYEKKVTLPAEMLKAGVMLTLGSGSPVAAAGGGRGTQGYAAALDSPVREAAVVYVNDQRVGAVWCPPYGLDVSGALRPGENTLRIDVANTAVNHIASHGFPNYDYTGINRVYGNRFQPQGTQLYMQPLPSGLAGPIKLEAAAPAK